VNGRAITVAPIDIGDILQLGPFRVEVVTKSISKHDSPATVTTKTSRKLRQANRLEAPNKDEFSEVKSKPSAIPTKVQLVPQSLTDNVVFRKEAEVTQRCREGTTNGNLVNHGNSPDNHPEVDHHPLVGINSIAIPEETRNVGGGDQPSSHPQGLPSSEAKLPQAVGLEQSISSFIKAHELQLLILKTQLDRFKEVYEKPRSQSISKQARSKLDKAMCETMKTHELMYESIKKLAQIIK
jgi:hypothetical protein